MSLRLFVAAPVSEEVRTAISGAREVLEPTLADSEVSWQDPLTSHLTLRFLGEVAERNLAGCRRALVEAARRSRPHELATGRFGAFPTERRPSVLWLGVEGELEELHRLQGAVSERLEGLIAPASGASFRPHLTVARLRRLRPAARRQLLELLAQAPPLSVPWRVESIQLLRSRLLQGGARHTLLEEARLGRDDRQQVD